MTLLSFCQADGIDLKRVASTKGGEYAGACPWCGGEDRFRVWPEQGRFMCRQCKPRGGDIIQYLRDKRGLSFPDACRVAGREDLLSTSTRGRSQPVRRRSAEPSGARTPAPSPERWIPKDYPLPGELWQAQAGKLIEYAAAKLYQSGDTWAYLNGRGLADDTIQAARLGLIPSQKWIKRELWGLPEKLNEHGKKIDLPIPAGIVIPHFIGGQVARVRIRRWGEVKNRYHMVDTSCSAPMMFGPEHDVIIVVESELDGLLLWQDCGDMAGVVALGSTTIRPDSGAAAVLSKSKLILMALDNDETGARQSWQWWPQHFTQAKRLRPTGGKDPGEMWQSEVDLRAWVGAGIDEYLK